MPAYLERVVDEVAKDDALDRTEVRRRVLKTIHALGLLVNPSNDEVYHPDGQPTKRWIPPRMNPIRYRPARRGRY